MNIKNPLFGFSKIKFVCLLLICFLVPSALFADTKSFYELEVSDLSGSKVNLSEYRGKVALVVNTASNCGFTYQYAGLEELYQKYRDQGFVVLAFPSNDFGEQEPGDNEEIKKFCDAKYNITFPVFSKAPVSGSQKQTAYKFLTDDSAKDYQGDPGWNFVKFLVGKDGKVINRFSSSTKPMSDTITSAIEIELQDGRPNQ